MKQRTFKVDLIENPFIMGWETSELVFSPPHGIPVIWKKPEPLAVCRHPAPFDFKLPSGTWVRKCGTCCAVLGSFAKDDSPEELIRTEAIRTRPEATWISKRRFVLDALPDSEIKRGLFSKLAVVSQTFHDQTGGMSLTGWQYEDLKQIWTRAYDQLTKFDYDSVALRHVIRQARAKMVEREKGRGRTLPRGRTVQEHMAATRTEAERRAAIACIKATT